ncbi:hypothetical protein MKEN_00176500 [Mycena kentingensis (nom. inval.)]|nr:hypothetical protein MKEN_00176500 [Mycena kentingensis (nom. inval.)]
MISKSLLPAHFQYPVLRRIGLVRNMFSVCPDGTSIPLFKLRLTLRYPLLGRFISPPGISASSIPLVAESPREMSAKILSVDGFELDFVGDIYANLILACTVAENGALRSRESRNTLQILNLFSGSHPPREFNTMDAEKLATVHRAATEYNISEAENACKQTVMLSSNPWALLRFGVENDEEFITQASAQSLAKLGYNAAVDSRANDQLARALLRWFARLQTIINQHPPNFAYWGCDEYHPAFADIFKRLQSGPGTLFELDRAWKVTSHLPACCQEQLALWRDELEEAARAAPPFTP